MIEEGLSFKEFYPALCNMEQKVESVEQYMKAIDNAYRILWSDNQEVQEIKYSPKLWFRGLRAAAYPLLPALGRNGLHAEYESVYLSKFKSKAFPYLDQISLRSGAEGTGAYWEWLFLMQHYGIPTRLMDWSEDALVALIFAIDLEATEEEMSNDAAVWCLNPVQLNTAFTFHDYYPEGYIPNIQEKGVYEMFGPQKNPFQNKKPAAVYSPINSPKIIVQRGTFMVFPYTVPMVDMKDLSDSYQYLFKIVIAKEFRASLTEQLRRYGITKAQLMPELKSIALELIQEEL